MIFEWGIFIRKKAHITPLISRQSLTINPKLRYRLSVTPELHKPYMGTPCLPCSLVLSHAGLQVRTQRPRRRRLLKATGWPRPPTPPFLSLSVLLYFILSFFLRSPSRCCFLLFVFLFTGCLNHRRSCNLPPRSEHLAHHLDENTLGLKKLLNYEL